MGVWRGFGKCLEGVSCVQWLSGGCLEGVWKVPGRYLKGFWRVSMGCPNGYLLSQDRSSQGRLSQDRSNQDRSNQDRSSKDRSSEDRSSQDWSSQDRSSQDRSSYDRSIQDRVIMERFSEDKLSWNSSKKNFGLNLVLDPKRT